MDNPAPLQAGWARSEITPPLGLPMAGYLARSAPAAGVLDPLHVRCLALRQGRRSLLFVCLEWLSAEAQWSDRLRARLARKHGLRPSEVIVASTHTHSGPAVPIRPFILGLPADRAARAYWSRAGRAIEDAAARAIAALQPVELAWTRAMIRGIATDRNRPARGRAQSILALRLRPLHDGPPAVFAMFGCHPTVLGPENDHYSADLHGAIARGLEARGISCAVVANGAAANISTRFTRRDRSPRESERLAAAIVGRLDRLPWRAARRVHLAASRRRLQFPLRPRGTPLPAGASNVGDRVWSELRKSRLFRRRSLGVEAVVWRFGPFNLIALPLEVGADTGAFLWRHGRIQVVGYANGYWGYLPSPAVHAGDYEAVSSPFPAAADERLRRAVLSRR